MNRVTRQRILELAMTAPSVDNSQPFYFQWDGDQLLIFRDEERDRRRGNVKEYVSMVGLGCLAECIVIAATGEGLAAEMDMVYRADRPGDSWLAVSFFPDSGPADELLPGLAKRCSDRRQYHGGALSEQVFQESAADADQFSACSLYLKPPADEKLLDYLLRCEGFLWEDESILTEMLSWVRWNQEEVQRTRDGMPWQALGVGYLTSRLMQLVARSARFRRLVRRSGRPQQARQTTWEAQLRSSAALGCLSVHKEEHQAMLDLGRLFLRVWVRLNLEGYGFQVMASPGIHAFQQATGLLPDDYPSTSKQVFAQGERILRESFGVPADEIPAWMFRTGRSSALPREMKSLRLPLSRVVRPDPDGEISQG